MQTSAYDILPAELVDTILRDVHQNQYRGYPICLPALEEPKKLLDGIIPHHSNTRAVYRRSSGFGRVEVVEVVEGGWVPV